MGPQMFLGNYRPSYKGDQDGMVDYREDCGVHQLYNGIYPLSMFIPICFSGCKPTAREPSTFLVRSHHVVYVSNRSGSIVYAEYLTSLKTLSISKDVLLVLAV
jgi:hypothetical protein